MKPVHSVHDIPALVEMRADSPNGDVSERRWTSQILVRPVGHAHHYFLDGLRRDQSVPDEEDVQVLSEINVVVGDHAQFRLKGRVDAGGQPTGGR